MIKLLGNKDVMIFLIQMLFKKWKKDFITKGGWKKPKSLFWMAMSKYRFSNNLDSPVGPLRILQEQGMAAKEISQGRACFHNWGRKWTRSLHGH